VNSNLAARSPAFGGVGNMSDLAELLKRALTAPQLMSEIQVSSATTSTTYGPVPDASCPSCVSGPDPAPDDDDDDDDDDSGGGGGDDDDDDCTQCPCSGDDDDDTD
jgi:hypothetical protein